MINKIITLSTFCLLSFSMFAQTSVDSIKIENPLGLVVDDVLAVVGEDVILQSEIESEYLKMTYENDIPADQIQDAKCSVLDQLILSKVLKTHAVLDSLVVGPSEVEYQLEQRLNVYVNQVPSKEDFEEYYGKTINQIKEQLRPLVTDYVMAEKKKAEITGQVRVTPAEVKRFFYRVPAENLPYFNAEVELAQIVMYPDPSEEAKQATIEKLNGFKEQVIDGADFAELAKEYSEDKGTAERGGDLGYFRKGQMVGPFEDVAFKLGPGELSRVVETDFGFHLIQVIDRKGESVNARHILIKPEIEEEQYLKIKEEMDSVYTRIQTDSTFYFEYAVDQYSQDDRTKELGGLLFNPKKGTSYFEIDELLDFNPEMYLAIDDLEQGEISKPIEFEDDFGRKAYRILYIQNQRDAHKMNLEYDFEVIKKRALELKQNEVLYEWLEGATSEVFIAVDQEYRPCPNMPIWLKANDN